MTTGLTELGNQHGAYLLRQFLPDQFLNEPEACLCARYDLSGDSGFPTQRSGSLLCAWDSGLLAHWLAEPTLLAHWLAEPTLLAH